MMVDKPATDFGSDNMAGISPAILTAIAEASDGLAPSYGRDKVTARVEARFRDLFETDLALFLVSTGTAANALSLSTVAPPYGAIFCHANAHVAQDECNAPEFFTGGAKLVPLAGAHGKIHAAELDAVLRERVAGHRPPHFPPAAALSLTQSTEAGTVYGVHEVGEIAAVAKSHGLALHMDGARFANAIAALGSSPAAITWRSGVDVLSFGATKNGALAAEAVVAFDPALAESLAYRRKRGGHLVSKMRFLAAQFDAYLADDLWLRNAGHANAMAQRLAAGLAGIDGVPIAFPVEANAVFAELPEAVATRLADQGFGFYRWGAEGRLARFVTSFATRPADVDALIAAAKAASGLMPPRSATQGARRGPEPRSS